MGMAASQARFLSLTARKTNVEYEGQQINQQRTTLSNESSNYYSQLCNLSVPTPPSSEDFTKTTYSFTDGSEKNTINTMIAKGGGIYLLNYTQSFESENVMSNGNVVTTRINTAPAGLPPVYDYYVGATKLRKIDLSTTVDPTSTPPTLIDGSGNIIADKFMDDLLKEGKVDEVNQMLLLEGEYYTMLDKKYGSGASNTDWFVRYQQNSTTGSYEPVFYSKKQVEDADYNNSTGTSVSGIRSYVYGPTTETREIKNAKARVEQDTSGRFISLFLYDDPNATGAPTDTGVQYNLTAKTESDDRAYNDAMNQYNYDKAKYDQEIQAINAKIEIIQGQDKDLELRLKQLDTEEQAISTEMEAVKKVVSKNVDSTFKTFNA